MPWDGTKYPSSEFVIVHDILARDLGWYMVPQPEIWDSTDGMSHSTPVHDGCDKGQPQSAVGAAWNSMWPCGRRTNLF